MCCTSTKLTSIDLSWRELYYIAANTFFLVLLLLTLNIFHTFLVLLTLNRHINRHFYHPIQTNFYRLKFVYTNVIMYSFVKPISSTLLFYFYYLPIHVTAISQIYAILCVICYLSYNFQKREKHRERMKEKKRERVLKSLHVCFSRFQVVQLVPNRAVSHIMKVCLRSS